jgi:small-conductance mechanosensitive channel
MPDGSANGNIIEINLNTVKVQNWDNTITTIPPYSLISSPFKNWRGMMESGGRRVDKMINLDVTSLEICSEDMIKDIRKNIPLMKDYNLGTSESLPTNSQLYRYYIERYLRSHPLVAQDLDLIIAQRQQGQYRAGVLGVDKYGICYEQIVGSRQGLYRLRRCFYP